MDIMGSVDSYCYRNRIQMLQGMLDRRQEKKIKESRNKEETPRKIEMAEIKTETIHDIIERQQEKKEKPVLIQNVIKEIRRAMIEKGTVRNLIESRIDMAAGMKRIKEEDKEISEQRKEAERRYMKWKEKKDGQGIQIGLDGQGKWIS